VFFIAFVKPTFPLQNSSLTNFVSYLGNAKMSLNNKIQFSSSTKIKVKGNVHHRTGHEGQEGE
jgi:hypothetical protein